MQLEHVTDGDSIRVRMPDGKTEKVRYIGIDTPEMDECGYDEATEANRDLIEGAELRLEYDLDRRDRFGRLLAYVFAGETMVNRELVREGWAGTLFIEPNTRYRAEFTDLASSARKRGIGLYNLCR